MALFGNAPALTARSTSIAQTVALMSAAMTAALLPVPAYAGESARPEQACQCEVEENRAKVVEFLEKVVSTADYDAVPRYVSPNVQLPPDTGLQGLEGYLQILRTARRSIEYTYQVEETIAEGNKVVARIRARGRQIGPLMGIPNEGRTFEYEEYLITEFEDGKMVKFSRIADLFSLLSQLRGETLPPGSHG